MGAQPKAIGWTAHLQASSLPSWLFTELKTATWLQGNGQTEEQPENQHATGDDGTQMRYSRPPAHGPCESPGVPALLEAPRRIHHFTWIILPRTSLKVSHHHRTTRAEPCSAALGLRLTEPRITRPRGDSQGSTPPFNTSIRPRNDVARWKERISINRTSHPVPVLRLH